jgi:hypothetical protein
MNNTLMKSTQNKNDKVTYLTLYHTKKNVDELKKTQEGPAATPEPPGFPHLFNEDLSL